MLRSRPTILQKRLSKEAMKCKHSDKGISNMKKLILSIVLSILFTSLASAADVKSADLAGMWYPSSKEELTNLLQGYLDAANPEKVDGSPVALISPHAGYKYSGPVTAYGYKLAGNREIKAVIIIGFSHAKQFDGISIYDRGSFNTPLGAVPVDVKLAALISAQNKRIYFYPEAFSGENSIEMQIPFIQLVFKDASIVPIAFGTQSYDDAVILADALAKVLGGRTDYLLVASTDLSHYHPYNEANLIDSHLITVLSTMKARDMYDDVMSGLSEACGIMPITATLLTAEKLGYNNIKVLKYENSGDTYGDKSKVVGYVSAVVYNRRETAAGSPTKEEGGRMLLNSSQRKRLLRIARESITSFVRDGKRKSFTDADPVLNAPMGAFVTLHERGELRGCIGNIIARGPLYKAVAEMAIEAATADPRFKVLSPDEIDKVDLEISVLSPLKKVSSVDEIKIPGHGVLVRRGFASGVYLPQVAAETGWSKEEFLTSLCAHKAGLKPDAWKDPSTEIYIFSAEVFGEKGGQDEI